MGLSRASKNLLLKKKGIDPEKFRNLKSIFKTKTRFKMFELAKKGLMSGPELNLRLRNLRRRKGRK